MEVERLHPDNPAPQQECTYSLFYYISKHWSPVYEGTIKHPHDPEDLLSLTIAALTKVNVMLDRSILA